MFFGQIRILGPSARQPDIVQFNQPRLQPSEPADEALKSLHSFSCPCARSLVFEYTRSPFSRTFRLFVVHFSSTQATLALSRKIFLFHTTDDKKYCGDGYAGGELLQPRRRQRQRLSYGGGVVASLSLTGIRYRAARCSRTQLCHPPLSRNSRELTTDVVDGLSPAVRCPKF